MSVLHGVIEFRKEKSQFLVCYDVKLGFDVRESDERICILSDYFVYFYFWINFLPALITTPLYSLPTF